MVHMYRYLSRTVAALAVAGLSIGVVACSNGADPGSGETPGRVVTVPAGGDPSTSNPDSPTPDSPAPSSTPSSTTNSPAPSTPASERDLREVEVKITWQEAVAAAQKKFDGELNSVSLEWERGVLVYSVELESADQEYDADIDPNTGEILRDEIDDEDDNDPDDTFDPSDVVDVADAMQTALDQMDGPVTEWKLEKDNGRIEYTFEIRDERGKDIEHIVDALTGKFVGIDD